MKAMLASRKYTQPNWRGKSGNATLEDLKAEFDETGPEVMANAAKSHGVKMQPVAWDATSGMGEPPTRNEFVYNLWQQYPETFFGARGSVAPRQGQQALHAAAPAHEAAARLTALADEDERILQEITAERGCLHVKALAVSGNALLALGLKPGAAGGETLARLLDLVLDEEVPNE